MTLLYDDAWLWLVIVGFIIAFILAFGLGANDVANSFGTSVGAKVLTLRQACILGSICNITGAILIGSKVSNTIRKGIVDPDMYTNGTEEVFMAGSTAALTGSCIWLLLATFFSLPVSTTHSTVGATLGFHLVVHGVKGIDGVKLLMIVASWFSSPILAGILSSLLFKFTEIVILNEEKPLRNGLRLLPVFYAVTLAINLFSVFYKGSHLLHFDKIPLYGTFILAFGPAIIIGLSIHCLVVPKLRSKIEKDVEDALEKGDVHNTAVHLASPSKGDVQLTPIQPAYTNKGFDNGSVVIATIAQANMQLAAAQHVDEKGGASNGAVAPPTLEDGPVVSADDIDADKNSLENAREKIEDKPETRRLFSVLQVLTAVFGSFAHGGNDVSNAIGPLVALWITATTGSAAQKAEVPIWILAYGGVGIAIGLCALGRRVIKTMGEDLSKVTPSSGFCIELGSALTVLIASKVGIPISTTHCKVGGVVCVGRVRSRESVDWKLFRNIVLSWFVTLPVAGALSALAMCVFKTIMKI